MKKFVLLLALALTGFAANAQIKRPKLVVGIIIDQMRWDYLNYYYDQYCDGGFKRLINEGFSCDNNMINYLPTVTAIGHTSTYTGATPAIHGIAGNNFQIDGKDVYCCKDTTVESVGSKNDAGRMSPCNLLSTTIGDQIRLATDFNSKVIGVALKDRAAILPAGRSANAAYWYDTKAGKFVTSTYYMPQLPKWVNKFNGKIKIKPGTDPKMLPEGATMTFDLAEATVKNEQLGKGKYTDMICVSISSTDAMSHKYGTRGEDNKAVYMATDKGLAHFLSFLDKEVGKGQYLLFLTADHGGCHNPNYLAEHKIATVGLDGYKVVANINAKLAEKYGKEGKYISSIMDCRVYLNHGWLEANNIDADEVKAFAIKQLKKEKDLQWVVDMEHAATASVPQIVRERVINGYNLHRSGDIMVLPRPAGFTWTYDDKYRGASHYNWNPYDSHIPLIFMGWHVRQGRTATPTRIIDTAATICDLLRIQMPNGCIGDAITEVEIDKK